jgi:hypothetical protein
MGYHTIIHDAAWPTVTRTTISPKMNSHRSRPGIGGGDCFVVSQLKFRSVSEYSWLGTM